jgi:hypothetical protein
MEIDMLNDKQARGGARRRKRAEGTRRRKRAEVITSAGKEEWLADYRLGQGVS